MVSCRSIGQSLALLGRNSLEVFACSTVLDLLGRLMFASFGINLWEQLVMNVVGLGLTYALAIPLDRARQRAKAARLSSGPARPAPAPE